MRSAVPALLGTISLLGLATDAAAQVVLDPIEVIAAPLPATLGTAETASEGQVSPERIEARPAYRPGEVLETVPGLIITQHSGEGKANQYFLRGFNLDHGTDFAIYRDCRRFPRGAASWCRTLHRSHLCCVIASCLRSAVAPCLASAA